MRTIFLFLILLICLQPAFAQDEKTLRGFSDTGDTLWYHDHQLIAILPFRMESTGGRYRKQAPDEQLRRNEIVFSMQVQQAFYNSIINDEKRWHVNVQEWRVTDSLLERAGVDFQKLPFVNKRALAAYLKVDAVIIGWLNNFYVPGVSTGGYGKVCSVTMSLYDGKTGDLLWGFGRDILPEEIIGNYYRLQPELYNGIRKQCPYTSTKTYRLTIHQ